ncbi:MAG: hypothetical protein LBC74_01825 [Planctomycetaceae bacterium]|jgi:uncharacterized FAD-dependent dehydrogenase|nr:hypothetical protein [Planctomycetaceae bacterium]
MKGCIISFYLVNLEKLRQIIGGKDLSFLKKLDLQKEDWHYAETLLMGTKQKQDQDEGSEYGYALESIIEYCFGESEEIAELNLDYDDFKKSPVEWIIKSGPPVKIAPSDDVPFIGHRTVAEMKKFLDNWNDEKAEKYDDDMLEIIETTLEVFQKAVKKKKDLVTFFV